MNNVVCVLEIADIETMTVQQMSAFEDNVDGNVRANVLFRQIVLESDEKITSEELEDCLDDGFYRCGNYYVAIVHSSIE